MGFGIGRLDGATCQRRQAGLRRRPPARRRSFRGNITAGPYCFMVFDVGNQSAPITYTAVILHY